jgi:hypothetical protein
MSKSDLYMIWLNFMCKWQSFIAPVRNLIWPNHPRFRKSYKRHQCKDVDMIIEDALFALLLDFWYGEVYPESIVEWEEETYEWLKSTVEWIEKTLPKMQEDWLNEKDYEKSKELEEALEAEIKRVLKEIIDRRNCLWT